MLSRVKKQCYFETMSTNVTTELVSAYDSFSRCRNRIERSKGIVFGAALHCPTNAVSVFFFIRKNFTYIVVFCYRLIDGRLSLS